MSAIVGMRGSGSWDSDARPKNYRELILRLFPHDKAPLLGMTSKLKEESVDDPEFKVFTKGLPTQCAQVKSGGSYNNTDNPVVIPFTASSNEHTLFKAGHVVCNLDTGEVMWVTDASVADQITCYRPHTKVAGDAADYIMIIGSAHEEGADTPAQITYDPSVVYNYTQIWRNAVALTNTAKVTRLRTGDQWKEAQKECLLLHNIEMEKAFFFGERKEVLTGDQPKRTTRGLYHWITTHVKDYSGGLDIDTWENDLEDIFRYGSPQKMMLGGARVINAMNKLARVNSEVRLVPEAKVYGMEIFRYVTPFGTIMMKIHPLFSENALLNKWAFIIDLPQLVYRYLKGRDTKYLKNRQGQGVDGVKDEYLTEAGLECRFEETHAVIKNLSTVVA